MSKREAREVARRRIADLRRESYESLKARYLNDPDCAELAAPSGRTYQVEIDAFWDHPKRPDGNLRVVVSAGSWFAPPTENFIIAPDGSFIGE